MSAFAARQQLWGAAAATAARAGSLEKTTPKAAPENEAARSKRGTTPQVRSVATRRSKRQPAEEPIPAEAKQQPQSIESEERRGSGASGYAQGHFISSCLVPCTILTDASTASPHPEPSGILIRQHSSFKPDKKNLQRKAGGRLVVSTRQGEVSSTDTLSRRGLFFPTAHRLLTCAASCDPWKLRHQGVRRRSHARRRHHNVIRLCPMGSFSPLPCRPCSQDSRRHGT